MAQQNNLDFNIVAHTKGMEQIALLINRVNALEAETKKLASANAGLASSTDTIVRNGARYNNALDAQSKAMRNARQGSQQLGMQFNDLATSISTGASPLQAMSQQLGQVGYAMSMMGGKTEKVGMFLAGPWGAAILLAASVLGPFIAKLFETEKQTEKLFDTSKEYTVQTTKQSLANSSLMEITDALNRISGRYSETLQQEANSAIVVAKAKIQEAKSRLTVAKAMIAENMAKAENFKLSSQAMRVGIGEPGARAAAGAAGALAGGFEMATATAQKEFDKQQKLVADAESALNYLTTNGPRVEASGGRGRTVGAGSAITEAQREANKLAEATTRYYANVQGKFVEEYQGYRVMMTKSDQEWADRLSALDDETFRNSLDRAAEMAKGIGYISQAAGEDISNFFQKPYEELQNSFQSIGMAVSDSFKGMLTGAMSWKDGMKSIISAVIDQLWQLYVVQQIVGFVTKALGGIGAPNPAAASTAAANVISVNKNAISAVKIGGLANGTVNSPGGLTWVGERGPELVNLPRGSQVIPAHRAQNMGGGGINITVDARGSNDPAAVRAQVQQGILEAAPAIIAAAQARTVQGLRRPRLGGAMQ